MGRVERKRHQAQQRGRAEVQRYGLGIYRRYFFSYVLAVDSAHVGRLDEDFDVRARGNVLFGDEAEA